VVAFAPLARRASPKRAASLRHVLPPAALTHLRNPRAALQVRVREPTEKWRGDENKVQHALPDDGKWAKGETETCDDVSSATLSGITVRHQARCAEPNCQTKINPGERAFYYRSDKTLYGERCGHGESTQRDFNAHRIDEDGF